MDLKVVLGANIRRHRDAQGLTLAELSRRCSLSESYLSRAEHGRLNLTVTTLEEIAKGLNVAVKDLFERTGAAGKDELGTLRAALEQIHKITSGVKEKG